MIDASTTIVIGDDPINSRDVLRCEIGEFNGRRTIALRKWFRRAGDNSLRPTPKGLTISIKHLPWIAKVVQDALMRARAENLLPAEGAGHEER